MTDFGRRAGIGDMLKSVYDTDDDGVVDSLPAHKTTHQDGGDDEITVALLSGELADNQPPKAHALGGAGHTISLLAALNALVFDADMDDGTTARTPFPHGGNHEVGMLDVIDATGLVGRVNYVDRGDPSAFDFDKDDLTADGAWHDLALSGIVPAGAVAVCIAAYIRAGSANQMLSFRKNGKSNDVNVLHGRTQAVYVTCYMQGYVACDTDRKIEYNLSAIPWTIVNVTVNAWLI